MGVYKDAMTSAGLTYGELIGSAVEVGCKGTFKATGWVPCDRPARTYVCGGSGCVFACHEHWREEHAKPWFHKSEFGTMLASDDQGIWIGVSQGWDLDEEWPPQPHWWVAKPGP